MGVRFPRYPKFFHIAAGLVKTKIALAGKKMEILVDLPDMKDPNKLAIIRMLASICVAVYYESPNLLPLIIFKMIGLELKYGKTFITPYNYAGYGLILCSIGEIDAGYKYGKLALDLLEKKNYKEVEARTQLVMNTFIRHWKEHAKNILEPLSNNYRTALDSGDFDFAAHSIFVYSFGLFVAGKELNWSCSEIEKYYKPVEKIRQTTVFNLIRFFYQIYQNMLGKSKDPCVLDGEWYDEEKMLPVHQAANDRTALFDYYCWKMVLFYLFQRREEAFKYAEIAKTYEDAVRASLGTNTFYLYYSLSLLLSYRTKNNNERKQIIRKVVGCQKKMKKWADYEPMNNLHKYYLVEAELARVKGNDLGAIDFYDKAIYNAQRNEYINEEALANELAGRFYLDRGNIRVARAYMREAYNCYGQWGAVAKLKHLEAAYPELIRTRADPITGEKKRELSDSGSSSSGIVAAGQLDLSTIIKTSQAISSEIDIKKLLANIMRLSIENAGAQRGFLILEREGDKDLYIEAESDGEKDMELMKSLSLDKCEGLSRAIVNYVNKTNEPVVLGNACDEGIFLSDPYVKERKPKSILCTPISHKGKVAGLLYLENNLATNAFTPERLELLRILSSQAAISLENAQLLVHRENEARLKTEMEIAKQIQTSLLPNKPYIKGFEISAYMNPADEVGGDYYDVIRAADRDWIVIGDVSGHGVLAGLVMMMVQTAIQTILRKHPDISPSELLTSINSVIQDNIQKLGENKYMTITVFCHEPDGKFVFSGLHQDLMIYRSQRREVETIPTDGTWIGLMEDIRDIVKDDVIHLHVGDSMLLYTDGITEAWDKSGLRDRKTTEMFGERRLRDVFLRFGSKSPEEIKNGILQELLAYQCYDDVTMVVLRRVA